MNLRAFDFLDRTFFNLYKKANDSPLYADKTH